MKQNTLFNKRCVSISSQYLLYTSPGTGKDTLVSVKQDRRLASGLFLFIKQWN